MQNLELWQFSSNVILFIIYYYLTFSLDLGYIIYICKKYHIELSSTKTKLQVYLPPSLSSSEDFYKNMVNIDIDGIPIKFVDSTEHVGVIRSVHGNLPHIFNRFSSHNKAIHSVLPIGLARGHHRNPAALWSSCHPFRHHFSCSHSPKKQT